MTLSLTVHVGYPKSASTTLQKHLFDRHPQIKFLGSYPTGNIGLDSAHHNPSAAFLTDTRLRRMHSHFVMEDEIDFAASDAEGLWREIVDAYADQQRQLVLSNERFTSVYFAHPDLGLKADRLQRLAPTAKILVVIREPISLALSQYRDHPFNPRHLSIGQPMSADDWMRTALEADDCRFFAALDYHRVLSYYWRLFGREQVGVFLFEELARDLSSFATGVARFLQIDAEQTLALLSGQHENRGISAGTNRLRMAARRHDRVRRLLPGFVKRAAKNLARGLPKETVSLSTTVRERMEAHFADANRRLAADTGLPLSQYGYSL